MKMRIGSYMLMGLLVLGLSSCSTVERGLIDNQSYYSTASPNIRIDIAESFKLDEKKKSRRRFEFSNMEEHRYVLINFWPGLTNDSQVDYYEHPSKWIFFKIPDCVDIEKGETDVLGKKWQYKDFVYHKSTASCALMRDMGIFTEGHEVLKVLYAQDLPPHQCKRWKGFYKLDGDQQKTLDRFLKNMTRDVKMTNYAPEPSGE